MRISKEKAAEIGRFAGEAREALKRLELALTEAGIHTRSKWREWQRELLLRRVDGLELSVRTQNCMYYTDIEYIWQLAEKTEDELLELENFGRKSLNEIKEILGDLGLELGMNLDGFPKHLTG